MSFKSVLDMLFKVTGVNPVKVHRIVAAAAGVVAVVLTVLQFLSANTPSN